MNHTLETVVISTDYFQAVESVALPPDFWKTWTLQKWRRKRHYMVVSADGTVHALRLWEARHWCRYMALLLPQFDNPRLDQAQAHFRDGNITIVFNALGFRQVHRLPLRETSAA